MYLLECIQMTKTKWALHMSNKDKVVDMTQSHMIERDMHALEPVDMSPSHVNDQTV